MEYINDKPYLPGATSLLEHLDSKILLLMRDGRHLVGYLRNFDQYLNMTLENASERIIMKGI
jgi:U6 snRNA-associated Sm-like protein LSm1